MKKCIAICLILLLLSGCASENEPTVLYNSTVFTDDFGRTVSVTEPKRIAVLLGSYAQICQLAGVTVCAAPDDAWEDLHLQMPGDTVNLGSIDKLNLELLLASRPDLVIASSKRRQHVEWMDTLTAAGIPVAYFNIDDFDDYLGILQLCTGFSGRKDLYAQYGEAVQAQIDAVLEQNRERLAGKEGPAVLCMTASASTIRAQNSEGTVLGAMLKTLGCVNIADSDAMLLDNLSIERILEADPDYIFIVQRGDDSAGMEAYLKKMLADDPAWASLSAVQNGRVYIMEKNLYNLKPNHRWGEAYEKLEAILANGE